MIQIYAFLFDDRNEEKMAVHGIRPVQLDQILDDEILVVRNRKTGTAPYLVIGRDWGGACIATPVEATNDPNVWRPITAWYCKDSEDARLTRATR